MQKVHKLGAKPQRQELTYTMEELLTMQKTWKRWPKEMKISEKLEHLHVAMLCTCTAVHKLARLLRRQRQELRVVFIDILGYNKTEAQLLWTL